MNESEEDELLRTFRQVNTRRRNRDQMYLRASKIYAMKILAEQLREWIIEETKDLLILIGALKNRQNQGITTEIVPYEKRIKEIQRTFLRKTISPLKKLGQGSSSAKTEEEHCRKFRIALDNVFGQILELREIRESLDAITTAVFSMESQRGEPQQYIS